MDLYFASHNYGKFVELKELLYPVFNLKMLDKELPIKEDGKTFRDNALIKATAYYKLLKAPTLADDSGLMVEALPSLLGIHSARFGGDIDSLSRNNLLLKNMKGKLNRQASFMAILCFYFGVNRIFFFEGIWKGKIAKKIRGDKGFGYDPLFIPDGKTSTIGEDDSLKKSFSHRAIAVKNALAFFSNIDLVNF